MYPASLFSGIGGFDLAAEWAGWTNAFNCEIDPFCRRVLQYHFPDAKQYTDIRATDFSLWAGRVDVLTGGFPCQPFSVAGKRRGTEDERHLWPEMLRAIREISPRWVVGENVRGILSWNDGMVFEQVCADLEAEGYEVQPFVLPACGVGAPHRRDRVWFVAHRTNAGSETVREGADGLLSGRTVADTDGERRPELHAAAKSGETNERDYAGGYEIPHWERFPTESPVCGGDDGFSARLDGITVPRWRAESIKAYGNAIVPQVACRIFKAIDECERCY
ncbi:DNA cytosine methyltransferase [Rikenella microfusus]|uniref:DNA cytosine methyltransferase n=1 Tax=Rikenella microfusus TaxID=28139 RepID=UPI00248D9EEE|nr:DNA cytosine methyltransferase [Rikenella microfusus]